MTTKLVLAGMTAHQLAEAIDAGKTTRAAVREHLETKKSLRAPSKRLLEALTTSTRGSVVKSLAKRDAQADKDRKDFIAEKRAEAEAKKLAAKPASGRKPASKPRAATKPARDDMSERMDRLEALVATLVDTFTGARK